MSGINVNLPSTEPQVQFADKMLHEALASMNFHFGGGREGLMKGLMESTFSKLDGEYNVMVFNMEQPYNFQVRCIHNPLISS